MCQKPVINRDNKAFFMEEIKATEMRLYTDMKLKTLR